MVIRSFMKDPVVVKDGKRGGRVDRQTSKNSSIMFYNIIIPNNMVMLSLQFLKCKFHRSSR